MLLQPHPREWWAARSSPDLHDCGGQCVLRVRQSPNGDSSHQPMLLSIKQVALRYSNARQWDSVCRTWCFSDACWLVHSRDSPLRSVADIPSCDRPYTGIAFPIPLSVLS